MNCKHCTAETEGLTLCDRCRAATLVYLEFLPIYFRNLARWRPGKAGARPVPGSREPTDGGRATGADRVSQALDAAGTDVTRWAGRLAHDRPEFVELPIREDEPATIAAMCDVLTQHMNVVAVSEWAGDLVTEAQTHEARLRVLTELVVPGWYAGACAHCSSDTHVVPGLTWVTCGGCGTTTYARDHLEIILNEARGWVSRPMRLAEAIVALVDTEVSVSRLHKRISKWGERTEGKRIAAIRRLDDEGDEVGPKRYRLGEVLDLLLAEGETRLTDPVAPVASSAS